MAPPPRWDGDGGGDDDDEARRFEGLRRRLRRSPNSLLIYRCCS
jgi:hypothetical protein